MERKNVRVGLAFISPWLLGFLIFMLYPIVMSLYLSFTRFTVVKPPVFIGLKNFQTMFLQDEYFWISLKNTAFIFLALPCEIVLGIGLAMLLNRAWKSITIFRTAYYIPTIVPIVATAMLWMWLYNPDFGLINTLFQKVGLPRVGWLADTAWAKPAFIIMELWMIGWVVIIYLASLQGVPHHLYEAAELDGANAWHKTRHVTLPHLSPVIFFMFIMGVFWCFQYFTQAYIMTDPPGSPENSTLFYALYLYLNAFRYFKMGYACAMAWVLFVITAAVTAIIWPTLGRKVYYEAGVK